MYLRRRRWLRHQIVVMCYIAYWFRSGAVLKYDQSNNTMLATATSSCAVTNVTYDENKYYVVTWIVYL